MAKRKREAEAEAADENTFKLTLNDASETKVTGAPAASSEGDGADPEPQEEPGEPAGGDA